MKTTDIRAALERDRTESVEQRDQLVRELDEITAAVADVATDDEHDPEGSTIAYERSRINALLEQLDVLLADIKEAVERLDGGSYGICTGCGATIAAERLEARPTVQTCISCASRS